MYRHVHRLAVCLQYAVHLPCDSFAPFLASLRSAGLVLPRCQHTQGSNLTACRARFECMQLQTHIQLGTFLWRLRQWCRISNITEYAKHCITYWSQAYSLTCRCLRCCSPTHSFFAGCHGGQGSWKWGKACFSYPFEQLEALPFAISQKTHQISRIQTSSILRFRYSYLTSSQPFPSLCWYPVMCEQALYMILHVNAFHHHEITCKV